MHSWIEFRVLTLPMGGQQEWLRTVLCDGPCWTCRVKHYVHLEHGLAATVLEQVLLILDFQLCVVEGPQAVQEICHRVQVDASETLQCQEVHQICIAEEPRTFLSQVTSMTIGHVVRET